MIVLLNNEGIGINGIARITGISKANVVKQIRRIAARMIKPAINESQQEYEVDELYTYTGNKRNATYIIYAINKVSHKVIDFRVGARTKENIGSVINTLKPLNPKQIFTDKLNIYSSLIEKTIHISGNHKINHIERFNLNLRTHLKRLTRKTICFSKSIEMLAACLTIYFWR